MDSNQIKRIVEKNLENLEQPKNISILKEETREEFNNRLDNLKDIAETFKINLAENTTEDFLQFAVNVISAKVSEMEEIISEYTRQYSNIWKEERNKLIEETIQKLEELKH